MPPPENPTFSTKKENTAGEISKNESKGGFSDGASAGLPAQAAGLSLRASLETGSRQIVKLHHFDRGTGIVVRQGGFFIGCAERKPKVFLGGMGFCVAGRDDFFVLHVGKADALRAMLQ